MAFTKGFPEKFRIVLEKLDVIFVFFGSLAEWLVLSDHGKKNYASSKEVNALSFIQLVLEHLRSQVWDCAASSGK